MALIMLFPLHRHEEDHHPNRVGTRSPMEIRTRPWKKNHRQRMVLPLDPTHYWTTRSRRNNSKNSRSTNNSIRIRIHNKTSPPNDQTIQSNRETSNRIKWTRE
jgi:hypothetical protein